MKPSQKQKMRAKSLIRRNLCELGLDAHSSPRDSYLIVRAKSDAGARPLTMKLYSGSGDHFTLRKSDLSLQNGILAYIWHADVEPEVFFATPQQALQFLGPAPLKTVSWIRDGYYKWSSASGLPKEKRQKFVEAFGNKWDWLIDIMQAPNTSLAR